MSIALNLMSLNMAASQRLNSNFAVQKASQAQMNLAFKSGHYDIDTVHIAGKQLTLVSLQEQFRAKMAAALEDSLQKKNKKDAKKQLDILA